MKVVLASASPRRAALLRQVNLDFIIDPPALEESADNSLKPEDVVKELARQKGAEVAKRRTDSLIISADTLVCLNGTFLGKPEDRTKAVEMLTSLSGKSHDVYSGVAVSLTGSHSEIKKTFSFSERTKVTFSALTDMEIMHYIDKASPFDKAGSYGIQDDLGALFVSRIEGDYNNVVGFPLHSFYRHLKLRMPGVHRQLFFQEI